jgi:hypothetical protein
VSGRSIPTGELPRVVELTEGVPRNLRIAWWGLILAGVLLRLVWLDTVPGINGDECLFGIRAYRWLQGEPVQWRPFPVGRLETSPILFLSNLVPGLLHSTAFVYLRIPTVVASLLTLWLVGRTWKPFLGPLACSMLVLLLAVWPQQIMYARFGFDPSLVPFCQALLIAAVVNNHRWWTAAATLLALLTYPALLLALPLALLLWLWKNHPHRVRAGVLWTFAVSWMAIVLRYLMPLGILEPDRVSFVKFCSGLVDVLSGEATFAYLVDPAQAQLGTLLATVSGLALMLGLTVQGWRDLSARPELSCLAAGTTLIAAALFLRLGTHAVLPPQDRNASSLVLPILAWLTCQLLRSPLGRRPRALWGILLALSFVQCYRVTDRYLLALRHQGSSSHRAFMSAPTEPRLTAFRQAREWLRPGAVVIAEDWWLFQPLTYLGLPTRVPVVHPNSIADIKQALQAGCVIVCHSYSPLHRAVEATGLPLRHITIHQAGGRPVVEVFAVAI